MMVSGGSSADLKSSLAFAHGVLQRGKVGGRGRGHLGPAGMEACDHLQGGLQVEQPKKLAGMPPNTCQSLAASLQVGHEVLTAAILDRLLHRAHVLTIKGRSYRLRDLEDAPKLARS